MILKDICIVYLTWGETPRSYGVFGDQVVEQFKRISKFSNGSFYFISGVPLLHSGMVREKWHYPKEIRKVKERLGNVKFSRVPIIAPQTFVNSSIKTFSYFHGISHSLLARKLIKIQPDVIHCRSYHAAWAALKVKEIYDFKYKIVFDGRDMWPEEIALKNNYSQKSADYHFLKNIEKELLDKCDLNIGVSHEMCTYYQSLSVQNVECVYLSADTEVLSSNFISDKYNSDIIRFCYVGALDENGWHKVSELHRLYKKLKQLYKNTHLTIVTTSDHMAIRKRFNDLSVTDFTITSSKSREELSNILSSQHFGLMAYFIPKNSLHVALGKILLAIKTVEYLSAGIPMICNNYCGGVSRLLKDNNLGVSYSPENMNIDRTSIQNLYNLDAGLRCLEFASSNFNMNSNAKKYLKLYDRLLKIDF
jgi:glycosyltransferase involved in cell wall biosynthesis